ncbi:MAG TPA: hypothetical protein VF753_16125 [Terriglobales bacterium]
MKRREFVKGLAQIAMIGPAATALNAVPVSDESSAQKTKKSPVANCSKNQLNVVVHGMFAIVVDRQGKLGGGNKFVYLKSPQVSSVTPHCYRAQAYIPDGNGGVNKVWPTDYDVSVTSNDDSVVFNRCQDAHLNLSDAPDRLIVDVSQKTFDRPSFWTVKLPIPDKIYPLRATPFNYLDGSAWVPDVNGNLVINGTYQSNGLQNVDALPTIYVLTYNEIAIGETVKFSGNGNLQTVPFFPSDGVARLHFYAEPETNKAHHSPADGLKALDTLFSPNLTLQFNPNLLAPDQPLNHDSNSYVRGVPGAILCEERSLSELTQTCADFDKTGTIAHQYAAVLAYKNALSPKSKAKGIASAIAHGLAPKDVKPPRNCIAMVGNYS